jgi:hypothetical protein
MPGRQTPRRPAGRDGWDVAAVMLVVNGVFAAVGGIYVATESVAATVVAAVAAVTLAALVLVLGRPPAGRGDRRD